MQTARSGAAARPSRGRDTQAPLILIVEDYEDNRQMYMQYLQFAGFRVAEAVDGHEAISKATSDPPDLIVMDLSLPRLDGWEATRRLKANSLTRGVPVLALTGHALVGQDEQAKKAGCDGYLTKPCLPEDLVGEIRRMLGEQRQKPKSRSGRVHHG
jgi:CheY-like chemotaxis protein